MKAAAAVARITLTQQETLSTWISQLDYDRQRLNLPDGTHLSRRELKIIRLFLQGYGQKIIADQVHLSVKTIEKYVADFRHQLCYGNRPLRRCMQESGLAQFILSHDDWFTLNEPANECPVSIGISPLKKGKPAA